MIKINQLWMPLWHTAEELESRAFKLLHIHKSQVKNFNIDRQSLDSRKKTDIHWKYAVVVDVPKEIEEQILRKNKNKDILVLQEKNYVFPQQAVLPVDERPVIVGAGPAGLFCGYLLAENGYRPIIIERGEAVEDRVKTVDNFWKTGILNTESNVQFGEGGAGTFSDGKLNTLVKDKTGRNKKVLEILVENGGNPNILIDSKPHLGTDELVPIVRNIREKILKHGGEIHFSSKCVGIDVDNNKITSVIIEAGGSKKYIPTKHLILAIGHSARDTFEMLYERDIPMESKSFAVGMRVEHLQDTINSVQYGAGYESLYRDIEDEKSRTLKTKLPTASYKLTAKASNGRGVYSFCMCPGGYVVNASTEEGRLAVNGMSYSDRNAKNANSAIIVTVTPEDFESSEPLAGLEFQRVLEEKAYKAGGGKIPVQTYGAYKQNQLDVDSLEEFLITPVTKGDTALGNLRNVFPEGINQAFIEGMEYFGKILKGFADDAVVLSGVESRTSSPVRIIRDDTCQSTVQGLYPCGEGAGYAGGITSAAMDGIKVAEQVAGCMLRL